MPNSPNPSRRRFIGVAFLAGLAGFVVGWSVTRAGAYPINLSKPTGVQGDDFLYNECWNKYQEVIYWFDGSGWTSTMQNRFRDGAATWDSIDNNLGNEIATATEVASDPGNNAANEVPVQVLNDDLRGRTGCFETHIYPDPISGHLEYIRLWWNNNPAISWNDFQGVATHEMGHAHGLKHVPFDESFDDEHPTMVAGCSLELDVSVSEERPIGSFAGRLVTLEQDDLAQFVWLFNGDINANPSFEDIESWTSDIWGTVGGSTLATHTSGGQRGSNYGRVGLGGGIYQTIRVVNPGDFLAKSWVRNPYSQATGTVTISLEAWKIDHDMMGGCEEQYVPAWELDAWTHVGSGFTQVASRTISLTSTSNWEFLEIDTSEPNEVWSGANGWDGVDLRIRITNNLVNYGNPWYLDVDWVRIKDGGL